MVREHSLHASFLDQGLAIQPNRHIPAKQTTVTEEQLNTLIAACPTPSHRLIIQMLASTGLRASEFCALKLQDVNLEDGYVIVQRGKGGSRRVGLSPVCLDLLNQHIAGLGNLEPQEPLFRDRFGQPLNRDVLLKRVNKMGKKLGIDVSPYALRRAFVTFNANKGRHASNGLWTQ